MRYHPINSKLFIENRKRLVNELDSNAVAVLHANDILPTNSDGELPLIQNSDLFYLSGIDQEESILVLSPDHPEERFKEVLFIRKTSPLIAVWEGHKLTKEQATQISGIKTVLWLDEFDAVFYNLMINCESVYLNSNEHLRANSKVPSRDTRFIQQFRQDYPLHLLKRLAPITNRLRTIKSDTEIFLLQQACDITEQAFRRVLRFVKPGVEEFEIEAEYIHEFVRNRSRGFAYTPIIASGANACILHYIDNNQTCKDGDLLLMDVGANYANYNADMTRTIPVNGKFTPRQKAVYNAVLNVKNKATKLLTPGRNIQAYQREVCEYITEELVDLKLITTQEVKDQKPGNPAYKKYFMHGVSHHLGLDVHDVGNTYDKMEIGNVFTVEPGIYIPEENIGVRIEDNLVINANGQFNLMRNIPITVDEIEDVMH